jgi:hypothetical protein
VACSIRERLLIEYNQRLRIQASAEDELRSRAETLPASEYQRLRATADESRIDTELARLDLEQHVTKHGCRDQVN